MRTIGEPFLILDTVDSTNIHAMALAHARLADHGTAVFAHHQTHGKGQRGRQWRSEPGENIILSVVLRPTTLSPADPFPLQAIAALACYDLFNRHAGDETAIKWPNDIYWRDRKAGGILVESSILGNSYRHVVVGMGININQVVFPSDIARPVSLRQITGTRHDAEKLARELCTDLEARYQQWLGGQELEMLAEYNDHLFARGNTAELRHNGEVRRVRILGVDRQGRLLVHSDRDEAWSFGEVDWIPGTIH
jgi:BirA family biotin operon repressor/biotin-[acetyl-CoA-carboxylase] ligase